MAAAADPDLELQLDAPLLEPRGGDNNWRVWLHLPRRDTSLAAFLVKSADVLAGGLLTLNVLNATHFLATLPKKNDQRLHLCFASTAKPSWKVFVLAIPFVLYPVTQWISGMAKMAENDRRGLSAVSIAVIAEFIWVILASGLLTHCISEANYGWVIAVMVIAVVLLLIVWTITFSRPRCLRRCFCNFCCCGLAPDIAAAQANDQSIAAAELSRQVAIAQEAFAAQVGLQNEAFAAIERARAAASAERVAKEKADEALEAVQVAANAVLACEAEMNIKKAAKAEADRIKQETEALAPAATEEVTEAAAHQASPEVEQNTSSADQEAHLATQNYSRIEQEATDAIEKHETAKREHTRLQVASDTANQNVARA